MWQTTCEFNRETQYNHIIFDEYRSKQEAQLSQRDRAPVGVIEFIPKSLKITQGR